MDRNSQVIFQIGDFITIVKGETYVTGQCMGFRVGQDGFTEELWIDGFYSGFDLGNDSKGWRVVDSSDGL